MNSGDLRDEELAMIDIKAILDWLATPVSIRPEDELAPLFTHLTALRETTTTANQRHKVLDLLYGRVRGAVERLLPELVGVSLPLSRRTRQLVRGMQNILQMIAEDYLDTINDLDERLIRGLRRPAELTLWRAIDALAMHLQISDYCASPPAPGIWDRLHRAYRTALEYDVADSVIHGSPDTPHLAYQRALLLACAQPASYTSREIGFVIDYVSRFGELAKIGIASDEMPENGLFWIEPGRDAPPVAAVRRPPVAGAVSLQCIDIARLAQKQVAGLESGDGPERHDLPATAATSAGIGVLRRLAHYWGQAGKRRFSRRRQNTRALLCIGLAALWQLFREEETRAGELSSWMITNESPEGYALMHVSGKTSRVTAGDVVALRSEDSDDWQICIVRWALSENPEHLEIGLQILANRATPALLAVAGEDQQSALLLPPVAPVRLSESLIVPTGTSQAARNRLVLMIERENVEIRELVATHLDEQTAAVEVISVESRPLVS